jgi:hypothetical protein
VLLPSLITPCPCVALVFAPPAWRRASVMIEKLVDLMIMKDL